MSVAVTSIKCLQDQPVIAQPLMRELRRADDFIRLAVMSVYETLADQFPIANHEATDWGLIVGTSFGPMDTNFIVLDQIVSCEMSSPTYFSHSVFNAAAGYLTRIFNIRGYTATLTDFYYPFLQALFQGYTIVNSGLAKRCFVLQAEGYSNVLQDARLNVSKSEKKWPMGATAWLLEYTEATDHPLTITSITIETTPNWQTSYLRPDDILTHNEETAVIIHPLSTPFIMSKILSGHNGDENHIFKIIGQNGCIHLHIGKPDSTFS